MNPDFFKFHRELQESAICAPTFKNNVCLKEKESGGNECHLKWNSAWSGERHKWGICLIRFNSADFGVFRGLNLTLILGRLPLARVEATLQM